MLKLCKSLFVAIGIKYLEGEVGWAKRAHTELMWSWQKGRADEQDVGGG